MTTSTATPTRITVSLVEPNGCPAHLDEFCPIWEEIQAISEEDA